MADFKGTTLKYNIEPSSTATVQAGQIIRKKLIKSCGLENTLFSVSALKGIGGCMRPIEISVLEIKNKTYIHVQNHLVLDKQEINIAKPCPL